MSSPADEERERKFLAMMQITRIVATKVCCGQFRRRNAGAYQCPDYRSNEIFNRRGKGMELLCSDTKMIQYAPFFLDSARFD